MRIIVGGTKHKQNRIKFLLVDCEVKYLKVLGRYQQKRLYFKDIESGDVFSFIQDLGDEKFKVYMKSGDKNAVNLETGFSYPFEENELVLLHKDAELRFNIK